MKPLLIVASPYYTGIHAMLLQGAERAIKAADFGHEIIEVPGAFEIPAAVAIAHHSHKYSGYIALGCVIRGETSHYDIVAGESARGLADLAVRERACIGLGILTVDTMEQAIVRADPKHGDKGGEAAKAAIRLIEIQNQIGVK